VPFWTQGEWLTDLLRSVRDAAPDFVDDLLARFAAQAPEAPRALPTAAARTGPTPAALIETLSERELETLRRSTASRPAPFMRRWRCSSTTRLHSFTFTSPVGMNRRSHSHVGVCGGRWWKSRSRTDSVSNS